MAEVRHPLLHTATLRLSQEIRELSLGNSGEIERIRGPISPLRFLRDYVMPGRPCIITHAVDHWPALRRWSNQYLCSVLRNQIVSVHFTPDGYGDALVDPQLMSSLYNCRISSRPPDSSSQHFGAACEREVDAYTAELDDSSSKAQNEVELLLQDEEVEELAVRNSELWFVTSHVEKLPFPTALDFIVGSRSRKCGVAYAQQQNGCFLSEYSLLAEDAQVHIPWATEALGCMPEAVNLWIGNDQAVTSFHKDHYENIYAVVAGEKHFTLLPPTDVHRLYVRKYRSAHYLLALDTGDFTIESDWPRRTVPWVSVDPYPRQLETRAQFPRYFEGPKPLTCTVKAGEMLYLPSMWFHHVRQIPSSYGCTIALNFWYDMQFDMKYAYFNFLESLVCDL